MKMRQRRRYLASLSVNIGNRCKGFEPECIICRCYAYKDVHGKFPSFEEVSDRVESYSVESDQVNGTTEAAKLAFSNDDVVAIHKEFEND